MSTFTATRVLDARRNAGILIVFAITAALGILLAAYPLTVLGAVALCVFLYVFFRWCRQQMEWWQMMVLLALTATIILNYGFDNLAVGAGGLKFPVGDLLMFLALFLVARRIGFSAIKEILLDPPVVCLMALLLMSFCHLVIDVPRYGFYAVRDASKFFEAVIVILGVVWTQNARSVQLLKRWLFYVLLVNLFYSYTFIWADAIQAKSPNVGVFHPVPLFGNYQQTALWLLMGVIYFIWIAPSVVRWPRWILMLLAAAQLGALAILQVRSAYVGIAVIFVVLLLFRETKKLAGFASTIGCGIGVLLALLLVVSALNIKLQGRMGPVSFAFVEEQFQTVLAVSDPNTRMSHDVDRADMYGEAWDRLRSNPINMVVGEGFGQVLVNLVSEEGIAVREPHNSSLSVLARLGFVGLSLWLLFIGLIFLRFVRALRMRSASGEATTTLLWLFLCFLLFLLTASVQPTFEFSHGSMPFYFMLGMGIGIIGQREYSFDPHSFSVRAPRAVGA
jgi:O-antigen ligase